MKKDISIIEENIKFQKNEWTIHRIGWVLMGLFLIAGLAGLWGEGPLSKMKVENEVFSLEYERYARIQKDFLLILKIKSYNSSPQIVFNSDYFRKIELRAIIPEPESMQLTGENLVINFKPVKNGSIIFYVDPFKMGSQTLKLAVNNKTEIVEQYIFF